jgi:hypothetical protein
MVQHCSDSCCRRHLAEMGVVNSLRLQPSAQNPPLNAYWMRSSPVGTLQEVLRPPPEASACRGRRRLQVLAARGPRGKEPVPAESSRCPLFLLPNPSAHRRWKCFPHRGLRVPRYSESGCSYRRHWGLACLGNCPLSTQIEMPSTAVT